MQREVNHCRIFLFVFVFSLQTKAGSIKLKNKTKNDPRSQDLSSHVTQFSQSKINPLSFWEIN